MISVGSACLGWGGACLFVDMMLEKSYVFDDGHFEEGLLVRMKRARRFLACDFVVGVTFSVTLFLRCSPTIPDPFCSENCLGLIKTFPQLRSQHHAYIFGKRPCE